VRIINPFIYGSAVDLTNGLLHWWDLDDDGVWSDDVGSWSLTESNAVGVAAASAPDSGAAADFAASGIYKAAAWDGSGGARSAVVWAKADQINGTAGNFLISHRSATDINFQLYLASSDNAFSGVFSDGAGTLATVTDGISRSTGEWYLVGIATNGNSDHKLWVNAVQTDSASTVLAGTVKSGSLSLGIGAGAWALPPSINTGHDGKLCMAGIWDRVLEQADWTALYNSGSGLRFADL